MGRGPRASVEWNGRRIWTGRGKAKARAAMEKGLEFILDESNKIVPLDEDTLQKSGKVSMHETEVKGSVFYNTPYAMRQHEELTWKHAPGRQAKYLETAMNANRTVPLNMVRDALRLWTRG